MPDFIAATSPRGHYEAEACIFWCYDARFSGAYEVFLRDRGFRLDRIDLVKGAGGAQPLAAEAGFERDAARAELAKSIKLHRTSRVILMVHMDCGAYGGSAAFGGDHGAEWDHHAAELDRAAEYVKSEFAEIRDIDRWIADFDGVTRL